MAKEVIRELGDGLLLRRGTPADVEALAHFNGTIHRPATAQELNAEAAAYAYDLASGSHPTTRVSDYTIVEDTATGEIVSSLVLIPQTWSYAGVLFGVGRPELVGTLPAYRGRGLVRAQFEVIHGWSAERGHLVQAITGIPWFYRQFGYEMAMALDAHRSGPRSLVPRLKEGESEPYPVRPAEPQDVPFIVEVCRYAAQRSLVTCPLDETFWRYELDGRSAKSIVRQELCIVQTAQGERVGLLAHGPKLYQGTVSLTAYELMPGVSWGAVTPGVLRYLDAVGQVYGARDPKQTHEGYRFTLGTEHPAYQTIPERLPYRSRPYAWYLRVADLPAFLRLIAPVLEARLADSVLAGHSGELKLGFYRSGLRLVFERGALAQVEPWMPTPADGGQARFPDLTFLQLLFGYRSLDELWYAFADCSAGEEPSVLLRVLFPKCPSDVWPIS